MWVTFRFAESPLIPVARTTSLYCPAASVPELIVSVVVVPEPEPGDTELDVQLIAPIPVGRVSPGSGSTESATVDPNEPDPTRFRVSDQVALLPSVAARPSVAAAVIVKSRVTLPSWTANGWYFTVR